MTIKVKITHDEPTSERVLHVGILARVSGFEHPQMQGTQDVKPGQSATVHVYAGAEIHVWEAPTKQELLVADEIELAMNPGKKVPAPTLDPAVRMAVARAAIAAAKRDVD